MRSNISSAIVRNLSRGTGGDLSSCTSVNDLLASSGFCYGFMVNESAYIRLSVKATLVES
jgi:hypothetical protein